VLSHRDTVFKDSGKGELPIFSIETTGFSIFSWKSQGMQKVSGDRKASKNLQKKASSYSMKCLQVVHTFSVVVGFLSTICWVIT
jgi:hypothetical protein